MANRSMPLVLAGLTGVCMLVGAGAAQAAPPRCENITVDDLRQACIERVERCEPLKSAAERDACYRGRTPKTADGAAAGPIKLTPNAAPVPTAPAPAVPKAASPAPSAAQVPAAGPAPVPTPPPPAPPPPASSAVVVRPGQPPIMATPAPIPQPAPKVDPAQVPAPAPAPLPKIVRPAPSPAVPAAIAPAPFPTPAHPTPSDGLDAVRGFYEALAQADGARANEFLVPEKRNSGAYEVGAMSRYYGNMREPVRLIAAEPMGNDGARVRYHYVYVNGRTCDGAAEVFLSRRDGRPLIERIRALNGC